MNNLKFDNQRLIDFIAIGRLCIDLNANEINRPMEETLTFTKYLGGSPANIAIAMSKLGMNTGFIGRVADDQMGRYIVDYLKKSNIDISNVITDKSGSVTGLAFTEIKSPTDCSILMYRDNVADLKLQPTDVNEEYIKNAKAILVSGTALAASPSREAVFLALDYARKHNTVVFFDIDYRPYTWKSVEEISVYYNLVAEKCDVIVGTREEFDMMEMLTMKGNKDDHATAQKWFNFNAKIVVIKHGKEGSIAYTKKGEEIVGDVFPVTPLKTFGAGDSYAGAFIYGLMQGWDIGEAMKFGAGSAAIVVSSHSCSDAMPTTTQIEEFILNYGKYKAIE
ncbi:5-dehydro-2-deoxygluconokinase [Marinisporobacter balticus]|uniref:5-dehydro-2-deoxygluconokinase n=1 Tax=Marinisporobacter balticus TaxID=2018667 RepID=A0A4R2KJ56_9FIRM|nr:5-dehydro-2-deoxygluconokinase [Marinisporobacter balticus]TCO70038.1 5-dehydro-2-deoxygluconokinase [Marinisporobacter balticus]